MTLLKHQVNAFGREYYMEKVNKPILKAIVVFGRSASWLQMLLASIEIVRSVRKYPRPTLENVQHPNSKWLLRRLALYLEYEGMSRIAMVVIVLVTGAIVKNEHSPNYRDRISWWFEDTSGWKPRSYNHPVNGWNEPKPYGGNYNV